MTKKVLIISLNYSSTPAIALSGRINIAVNARGVFIADYGILEENITYLSDEWTPLTKVQIMTAVQALVDESTSLEEIYIYYAGYGSGIQIVKSIDWALMPETLPMDIPPMDIPPMDISPSDIPPSDIPPMDIPPMDIPPSDIPPSDSLPVDDSTITITIDELEPSTTVPVEPTTEALIVPTTEAPTEPTSEAPTEETSEPSSEATTDAPIEETTEPIVPTINPLFPPQDSLFPPVIPQEPIIPTIEPIVPTIDSLIPSFIVPSPEPPPAPEPPLPYKYDFYPMTQSYDKLTKQMVGSDYEIITNSEILDMLKNTKCRTICVLDMCPLVGTTEPFVVGGTTDLLSNTLTWGTDIIGNVNIISFAEPDSISSGKLATIQVITQHIRG